jgi:hypothetical protein
MAATVQPAARTPKVYCRIRRFQRAVRRMSKGGNVPWSDIALACGYFDQAHFANDFRVFRDNSDNVSAWPPVLDEPCGVRPVAKHTSHFSNISVGIRGNNGRPELEMEDGDMKRTWPIIAVSDVVKSSVWYTELLDARNDIPVPPIYGPSADENPFVGAGPTRRTV